MFRVIWLRQTVKLTTFYSIEFGTKKYIRVLPLRFFSISVKIFFGPPFDVFLEFSWGLNFVYQFISLFHEIQICEEIIWCWYTVIITWTLLFTIGKTQVLRKMGIQFRNQIFFLIFFLSFLKTHKPGRSMSRWGSRLSPGQWASNRDNPSESGTGGKPANSSRDSVVATLKDFCKGIKIPIIWF